MYLAKMSLDAGSQALAASILNNGWKLIWCRVEDGSKQQDFPMFVMTISA
jgi:hypothetical protein